MLENVKNAQLLGIFKTICDKNYSYANRKKLQNILAFSENKIETITNIVCRECNVKLSLEEANRILTLLNAFFKKSCYRKAINISKKKELLIKQNYCCAICHCDIHQNYHADHIVPFKYVGDELDDNLQLLCSHCNEKKKISIDYQIRYSLNLI